MGWFSRKHERERLDQQLLIALLEGEKARIAANAEIEKSRANLQLRQLELEVENAEALQEARTKDRIAKAELREKQREWTAKHRAAKAAKEQAERERNPSLVRCPVCADPGSLANTVEQITWHNSGHPGAAATN